MVWCALCDQAKNVVVAGTDAMASPENPWVRHNFLNWIFLCTYYVLICNACFLLQDPLARPLLRVERPLRGVGRRNGQLHRDLSRKPGENHASHFFVIDGFVKQAFFGLKLKVFQKIKGRKFEDFQKLKEVKNFRVFFKRGIGSKSSFLQRLK